MAHYNFEKDYIDGNNAQLEVKKLLIEKYKVDESDIEMHDGKEYDIKIKSLNLTFEVKNDLMAGKTGNIAVEYESRGKPSGIATTKASYWIYKISDSYFMIETSRLKKEIYDKNNFSRKVTGGDANSNTKMFLIKVDIFKSWSEKI